MASVFTFVTEIEKISQFENVRTRHVTSRTEHGVDLADFEIVANIKEEE